MLEQDIIEPCESDWSSPVVLVKKPNGKKRFCVDFRKVNSVTKRDAYPLPNMTAIMDELRGANYISTLDLSQAYWQVPLDQESKQITAFTVPGRGLFQFKRMPYGLTNAPADFQRQLDKKFGPKMYPNVFVYLDDIIIVSKTFEEHLEWLAKVLDILNDTHLTVNREKCEFCRQQVKYLGYLVNSEGLQVDPDKTASVLNFPRPQNLKQIRRFLGMTSWYRRFIPNFASVAEPLNRLTRKEKSWEWGESQQVAFDALKTHLTSAPTLACPEFSLPFTVQTDASSVGLGAVLTQVIDEKERVIAYASRALTDAEKKYTVTEQECLAVVWAIKKFRCYVEGYTFKVITDHSSLRWLHNLKDPSGRLARWALGLMEYDFTIEHRKGALHHVPDALSRIPEGIETISMLTETKDKWYLKRCRDVEKIPEKFPTWKFTDGQLYHHKRNALASLDNIDLDAWKLVLPREARNGAITQCHDEPQAGHQGLDRTYQRLAIQYYWPNMYQDVVKTVSSCITCQQCKVEQRAPMGLMGPRKITKPWSRICADIMGPYTKSKAGYCYILVIQDLFTKWIEICPLRKATGTKISEVLEDSVINRWGRPDELITDNGTEFVNKAIKALSTSTGMKLQTTPPYHPQANPTERVNRSLKAMIRAFLDTDHREWDRHLNAFRFAYNTAYHSSLKATPAFANFGREPEPVVSLRRELEGEQDVEEISSADWIERMRRHDALRIAFRHALSEANDKQAQPYNLRRRNREFQEGELVLSRNHELSNAAKHRTAALTRPFIGPLVITKKLSKTVYELSDLTGKSKGKVSIQDMKPYITDLEDDGGDLAISDEGEETN